MPVDIKGLDWAEVLFELYRNTEPLGLSRLSGIHKDLTLEDCKKLIPEKIGRIVSPDYLCGRPIKVTFEDDTLYREDLYDRDCPGGPGSCERVVAALRKRLAENT